MTPNDIADFKKSFDEKLKTITTIDEKENNRSAFYAPSFVSEEHRGLIYAPKINKDLPVYKSSFRFIPNRDVTNPVVKVFTWTFYDASENIYFSEASPENFNYNNIDPIKIMKNMSVPEHLREIQKDFNEKLRISPVYLANIALENDSHLSENYQKTNWIFTFKSTIINKIQSFMDENQKEIPISYKNVPLFAFKCNKGPASSGDRYVPNYSESLFIESNRQDIDDSILAGIYDIKSILKIPTTLDVETTLENVFAASNKYGPLINHYLAMKSELMVKKN